jgi:hypothetical protein
MMSPYGTSLSSEFGDGFPHSLGRVPQKRFFDFRDFLKIVNFNFFLIQPIGRVYDPSTCVKES